jgi:hypothetical protein
MEFHGIFTAIMQLNKLFKKEHTTEYAVQKFSTDEVLDIFLRLLRSFYTHPSTSKGNKNY